jgi:hypothetical protein
VQLKQKDAAIKTLEDQNKALEQRLNALERLVRQKPEKQ